MKKLYCAWVALALGVTCTVKAQLAPQLTFTPVITGLSSPVDVVTANDGTNRIFVVQRAGTIRVYDASYNLLNATFLTLSGNFTSGGERGLLSLAFHPDYENNRYFFVYYTNGAGGVNVDRFQTLAGNPNQVDATTRTNVMSIPKPVVYSNHNGGKLNFGSDGNLYFALGDSGSGGDPGNLAQNGNSLWGKMIRINVDNFLNPPYYTVPASNPFVSDPNVLDEIYNLGLRNPWRWSFDRVNGDMWIADVGQGAWEEVNRVTAAQAPGINYGWRCYEGNSAYNTGGCQPQSAYQAPVFEYPHNNLTGGFSITGGYVYRGSQYTSLYGFYVCADYVSGNVWMINENPPGTYNATIQSGLPGSISSFGERENGELLALSLSGILYRVSAQAAVPVTLISFTASASGNGVHVLNWESANESDLKEYVVQQSVDGIRFEDKATLPAKNLSSALYSSSINQTARIRILYRLKIVDKDGRISYSPIAAVQAPSGSPGIVFLGAQNDKISLSINKPIAELSVYDASAKLIKKIRPGTLIGRLDLDVNLVRGIYFVRVVDMENNVSSLKFLF